MQPGVLGHRLDPRKLMRWIEGHVRAAGFQDSEDRHQHVRGARNRNPDQGFRTDAKFLQVTCELIGAGVELMIRQPMAIQTTATSFGESAD
jgi:hypothetical protein